MLCLSYIWGGGGIHQMIIDLTPRYTMRTYHHYSLWVWFSSHDMLSWIQTWCGGCIFFTRRNATGKINKHDVNDIVLAMVWNAHIPIQNMKGCIYYLHTRHRWKSDIQTLLMNTLIVVYRCKSYHHIIMATETPQYLIVKLNILQFI
jgi:hypothetical protein